MTTDPITRIREALDYVQAVTGHGRARLRAALAALGELEAEREELERQVRMWQGNSEGFSGALDHATKRIRELEAEREADRDENARYRKEYGEPPTDEELEASSKLWDETMAMTEDEIRAELGPDLVAKTERTGALARLCAEQRRTIRGLEARMMALLEALSDESTIPHPLRERIQGCGLPVVPVSHVAPRAHSLSFDTSSECWRRSGSWRRKLRRAAQEAQVRVLDHVLSELCNDQECAQIILTELRSRIEKDGPL